MTVHRSGSRTVRAAVAIAVAGGALAGCAAANSSLPGSTTHTDSAGSSGPVTILDTFIGIPPGFMEHPEELAGDWVALAYDDPSDPVVLRVVVRGSSTCPYLPTAYAATPGGRLTITVKADLSEAVPYDGTFLCSADASMSTTTIALPADVHIPAEITVEDARGCLPVSTIPVQDDYPG